MASRAEKRQPSSSASSVVIRKARWDSSERSGGSTVSAAFSPSLDQGLTTGSGHDETEAFPDSHRRLGNCIKVSPSH